MTCENKGINLMTDVVIAANVLVEAKTADPGSDGHVSAMTKLLDLLRKPRALDALMEVVKSG